jgi:hypothetical protein
MSHHLDSPAARADARLNISDTYVFRGDRGTVFVMDVCSDAAGPDAPKGFHPEARYEFRIDSTGDAVEDLAYRFTFGAAGADGAQGLELRRLAGEDASDDHAQGVPLLSGTTGRELVTDRGLRVWAGRAADPFWMNPAVVEAVGHAFQQGTDVDVPAQDTAQVSSLFAGQKVSSLVLEVPDADLLPFTRDSRIGVWATTALATDAGGWHRINRCGLPMVSPIFAQFDDELAERLNRTAPADDRLLPDVLPYVIGTPAVFGFTKFNGRALTDNAGEVMFSLTTDSALSIGMSQDAVDAPTTSTFPYVAAAA